MKLTLSHKLRHDTPLYGDFDKVGILKTNQISQGDSSNNSRLDFPSHSGTHVDAPSHFDDSGKHLDCYAPDFWFCSSPFLIQREVNPGEIITYDSWKTELEKIPSKSDILLIKTGFEKFRDSDDNKQRKDYIFNGPGIAPDVGNWLRKNRNLKFIGFDFISLTSFQNRGLGRVAHRSFLSSVVTDISNMHRQPPILIIEDMKLSGLNTSPKSIVISPLFYCDADGAPVTVFAEV